MKVGRESVLLKWGHSDQLSAALEKAFFGPPWDCTRHDEGVAQAEVVRNYFLVDTLKGYMWRCDGIELIERVKEHVNNET